MKSPFPRNLVPALAIAVVSTSLASRLADAAITPLNFADGDGTTLVDQYTGVAGGGWFTDWKSATGSAVNGFTASVTNVSPISSGGGNYLGVTYNTTSGANNAQSNVVARQLDLTAISLSTPITVSFDFRSNTIIRGADQVFSFYASTGYTNIGTSPADSWKIAIDGGGVSVIPDPAGAPNTQLYLNAGTPVANNASLIGSNAANTPLRFSLTIDPVANTYTASVTNLTTNVTLTSGSTVLNLRNGADASLGYINFLAGGQANRTGLGYSIDNISVVAVPEPSVASLIGVAGILSLVLIRRRRQSA